jgi:Protein kinase domain
MSKWLRRGFGQNSNTITQDERLPATLHPHSEFPSPPRNTMPGSSTAAAYHHTAAMPHYGVPAPATIAMDIDNPAPPATRSKYTNANYHPQSATNSKMNERSRDDGTSSSRNSRRSTSVDQRARTTPSSQPAYRQGTGPPSSVASQQYPAGSNHQSHPTPSPGYNKGAPLGTTTPPDSIQPSYPPPAVTSESPPSSELAQRRPAYLLHRDLVIGKGSYGEPEGHASGRQGKRKKFACKCVMLRNDPKYIAKLQEEVNVLRELRGHDNVIRLYDVFCVDNELFIITELGRGGDLFHLLTTHPKHGVTEAYAGTFLSLDDFFVPQCVLLYTNVYIFSVSTI